MRASSWMDVVKRETQEYLLIFRQENANTESSSEQHRPGCCGLVQPHGLTAGLADPGNIETASRH